MLTMRFNRHQLICNSFQIEILRDARDVFVEAFAELRSHLWSYISNLTHLFDILFSSNKLKTRQFKIGLAIDDDIRNVAPSSILLVNAFDYVDERKNELLSISVNNQLSIDSISILAQPDSLHSERKINVIKLPVSDLREPNHLVSEKKNFTIKT